MDLEQLADSIADYPSAYLITAGDEFRAHAIAVQPVLIEGAALMVVPARAVLHRGTHDCMPIEKD